MPEEAQSSDPHAANPRIVWPAGHRPDTARVFAQNSIEVAAPPDRVWTTLIDCTAWPRWYRHCSGVSMLKGGDQLGPGAQFRFKTLGFWFEPAVDTFEPKRMLVWSAKGPAGASGAHAWLIEPTPAGCRVITEEVQQGALLILLQGRMRRQLLGAHADWLRGLKALAEGGLSPAAGSG